MAFNVGGVAGAAGGLLQGIGSLQAGNAEARASLSSAKEAYAAATESRRQAGYKARLIRELGAEMGGQMAVTLGKGSVAMSGTPLATLVTNARQAELTAAETARTGLIEKDRWMKQGKALERAAKAAKSAGKWGMAAGIASAVGSIGGP